MRTLSRPCRKGWTVLNAPGYPMAKNLRTKIPDSDTMVIYDVTQGALDKFKSEVGNVEIAKSVREVAEKTVRITTRRTLSNFHDELLFYL